MFKGSLVALVTPMNQVGDVDYSALERLITWHIAEKTDGLVILGTTGESATISPNERSEIIKHTVEQVAGRLPIIVGTGANCTKTACKLTQQALELGADACLLVTPYYNKPTQEGLFEHYKAIANAVAIPQILYNVPSRTGCDLLPETMVRLAAECSNIIGVKEATGDLDRLNVLLESLPQWDLYSGDDDTAADFIAAGGKGVISVNANIVPNKIHELCEAILSKDSEKVYSIKQLLAPLNQVLFLQSNPIPVKWLLAQMGMISGGIRLPLTPLSSEFQQKVLDVAESLAILPKNK